VASLELSTRMMIPAMIVVSERIQSALYNVVLMKTKRKVDELIFWYRNK